MSFRFTDDGLQIQTYDEIYAELVASYQSIYGADINTDADSPDGQRIGIEAKARLDLQTIALSLYNQMDPDFASGEWLNTLIKLSGISRRPTSRSQVDVTITTDRDLTLDAGYAVNDDLDQTWSTLTAAALTTGANTVTLVAEFFGAVEADAGTVTTPATVVLGVISVTNPLAATIGLEEETDPELRTRRNLSLIAPRTSSKGGMFTALGNVARVTDVVVYENDTDSYDASLALDAHSLWCLVEGGEVADIVGAMAKVKTSGTGLKGSTSGTYVETLYKPDLTPYTYTHTMYFDRPVAADLYVSLTVEGVNGAVVDTAAIENALAALSFAIGEGVSAGDLYETVYNVANNFTVTLLKISDDDIAYTDGRLDPDPDGVFGIDAANVTVTDIT